MQAHRLGPSKQQAYMSCHESCLPLLLVLRVNDICMEYYYDFSFCPGVPASQGQGHGEGEGGDGVLSAKAE